MMEIVDYHVLASVILIKTYSLTKILATLTNMKLSNHIVNQLLTVTNHKNDNRILNQNKLKLVLHTKRNNKEERMWLLYKARRKERRKKEGKKDKKTGKLILMHFKLKGIPRFCSPS